MPVVLFFKLVKWIAAMSRPHRVLMAAFEHVLNRVLKFFEDLGVLVD